MPMSDTVYLIYLLFWLIIFGGIGALIGRNKKRELAGFLWGMFLGPLGWLLVAVGPDYSRKCPDCKGKVPDDAKKCKHCGATLQET